MKGFDEVNEGRQRTESREQCDSLPVDKSLDLLQVNLSSTTGTGASQGSSGPTILGEVAKQPSNALSVNLYNLHGL